VQSFPVVKAMHWSSPGSSLAFVSNLLQVQVDTGELPYCGLMWVVTQLQHSSST
jgi:hypothetical protein